MRNERFDFLHLPEKYHQNHKLCEFLFYQIEDFVHKDSFRVLRIQTIQLDEEPNLLDNEHFLDYLIRINKSNEHDGIVTNLLLNATITDICHFIQMALFSSLQMRLTVVFALIRKPFVYDLLIILRLYFTSDFLEKFNTNEGFDSTGMNHKDIQELLEISEGALLSKSVKAKDIYDIIFNSELPDSIINTSNKALHPSTTRNKNNRTGAQNINFIFSNSENIANQWDYLYSTLPLLLLYMNELFEFIIFDHLNLTNAVYMDRLTERADYFTHMNER